MSQSRQDRNTQPRDEVGHNMRRKNTVGSAISLPDAGDEPEPLTRYQMYLGEDMRKSVISQSDRHLSDDEDFFSFPSEQCDIIMGELNPESMPKDQLRKVFQDLKNQVVKSIDSVYLGECKRDEEMERKIGDLENCLAGSLLMYREQVSKVQRQDGVSVRQTVDRRLQNMCEIAKLMDKSIKSSLEQLQQYILQIAELKNTISQISMILADKKNTISFLNATRVSLQELNRSQKEEFAAKYAKLKKEYECNLEEIRRKLMEQMKMGLLENQRCYNKDKEEREKEIERLKSEVQLRGTSINQLTQKVVAVHKKLDLTRQQLASSKQEQQKAKTQCREMDEKVKQQLAYLSELDSSIYQQYQEEFSLKEQELLQEFAVAGMEKERCNFDRLQKEKSSHQQQMMVQVETHHKEMEQMHETMIERLAKFKSKMDEIEGQNVTLIAQIERLEKQVREYSILFAWKDEEYRTAKDKWQLYQRKWVESMRQLQRERIEQIENGKIIDYMQKQGNQLIVELENRNLRVAQLQNELYLLRLGFKAKDVALHRLEQQKHDSSKQNQANIEDIKRSYELKLEKIAEINRNNMEELIKHYESVIDNNRQIHQKIQKYYSDEKNKLKNKATLISQLNEVNVCYLQRELQSKQRAIEALTEEINEEEEMSSYQIKRNNAKLNERQVQLNEYKLLLQKYQHKITQLQRTISSITSTIQEIGNKIEKKQPNMYEYLFKNISDNELSAAVCLIMDSYESKQKQVQYVQTETAYLQAECRRLEETNFGLLAQKEVTQQHLKRQKQIVESLTKQQHTKSAVLKELEITHQSEIAKYKNQYQSLHEKHEKETKQFKIQLDIAQLAMKMYEESRNKVEEQLKEVESKIINLDAKHKQQIQREKRENMKYRKLHQKFKDLLDEAEEKEDDSSVLVGSDGRSTILGEQLNSSLNSSTSIQKIV